MQGRALTIWHFVRRNAVLLILLIVVSGLGYSFVRRMFLHPPVDARRKEASEVAHRDIAIQLQILNATPVQGLASNATDYLRQRGFDVVMNDNAPEKSEVSSVICLRGDTAAAAQLAYAVGIERKHVVTQIDSSLMLDCTLILGSDYSSLKAFRP